MHSISKKDAQKKIDQSPTKYVLVSAINIKHIVHLFRKNILKEEGKKIIDCSNNIFLQNNDFFITMILYGVDKSRNNIVYTILFPYFEVE